MLNLSLMRLMVERMGRGDICGWGMAQSNSTSSLIRNNPKIFKKIKPNLEKNISISQVTFSSYTFKNERINLLLCLPPDNLVTIHILYLIKSRL